jgi:hypothetical protein
MAPENFEVQTGDPWVSVKSFQGRGAIPQRFFIIIVVFVQV